MNQKDFEALLGSTFEYPCFINYEAAEKPGFGINRFRIVVEHPFADAFKGKMAVDFDGAPTAYHVNNDPRKRLDNLRNGMTIVPLKEDGKKYHFSNIADAFEHEGQYKDANGYIRDEHEVHVLNGTGNNKKIKNFFDLIADRTTLRPKKYDNDKPVAKVIICGFEYNEVGGIAVPITRLINGENYFISTTAFQDKSLPKGTVGRNIDATQIAYFVLSSELVSKGIRQGDIGLAINTRQPTKNSFFIIGDYKGKSKGEGSVKLAENLDILTSESTVIKFFFFRKSNSEFLRSQSEVDRKGALFLAKLSLNPTDLFNVNVRTK